MTNRIHWRQSVLVVSRIKCGAWTSRRVTQVVAHTHAHTHAIARASIHTIGHTTIHYVADVACPAGAAEALVKRKVSGLVQVAGAAIV